MGKHLSCRFKDIKQKGPFGSAVSDYFINDEPVILAANCYRWEAKTGWHNSQTANPHIRA